ncbi:MAG: TlpA family protein disulfide reductase [Actinomycetes bacterium]
MSHPDDDSTNDVAPSDRARGQRRLPVGPLGLVVVTLIAITAATLVVRIGLRPQASDAVDVQDALQDQVTAPLIPPDASPVRIGSPAPNVQFRYLDGGVESLADLRGTPLVVNFWSSTCAPCRTEMPALQRLNAAAQGAVRVVGVNVADTERSARAAMMATGVRYRSAADPDAALLRIFGGTSLPRTVLIDGSGIVRDAHSGELSDDQLRQLLRRNGLLPE